jgi:hypothetical protein
VPLILFSNRKKTAAAPVVQNLNYDPYWDKVVLLMHMNESVTKDEKGHTVSTANEASLTNVSPKFGANSAQVSTSSQVYISNSNDFNFGTEDFTVEGWFNWGNRNRSYCFDGAGNDLHFVVNNTTTSTVIQFSDYSAQTTNIDLPPNTWHHIAMTCIGDTQQVPI